LKAHQCIAHGGYLSATTAYRDYSVHECREMILPGADGSIGAGRAARARPHGYTIDVGFLGNHVLNGGFYSLQYYVLNDFARILPLVRASVVLFARKTLSANDLNELIDRLVEGQSQQGDGGSHRSRSPLASRILSERNWNAGCPRAVSWHPPAVQDLAAGQIDLWLGTPDQLPLMRAGTIKAYAVTSDRRMAVAPDIPTFGEMGLPALTYYAWDGAFAPKNTPQEIIGKLNAAAWRHSPIQQCDHGSSNSRSRFFRASDRHRRRSARS
jgi:tripartite-type tricarboxylate transporter receptor subunit TctC